MSQKRTEKKNYNLLAISILSAIGILLSLYLTYVDAGGGHAAFCTAGTDCDVVRQSAFAKMLGIPVAAYGVAAYGAILAVSLLSMARKKRWLILFVLSLAGFVFTLYLTYLELFVINAICMYCVVSAFIITAIFILTLLLKKTEHPKMNGLRAVGLGLVVAGVVFFGAAVMQGEHLRDSAGVSSSDPYQTGLAKHLGKIGAVMYGSFKCTHCLEQKRLFGDAFKYVTYVECHPQGPDANPSLCFARGIQNYPTWEISGAYYQGTMSLERLAQISGYQPEN